MTTGNLGGNQNLTPILEATTPCEELYATAEQELRLGGVAAQAAFLDGLSPADRELYFREFSNMHVLIFGD